MHVVLGYILLAVNLLVVIMMTTDKLAIYFDLHSFLCVFGGTLLSSVIAFGPKSLMQVVKVYRAAMKKTDINKADVIAEIVKISRETKGEITPSFVQGYKSKFHFLQDGLGMIADGFSRDQITQILDERIDATHTRYKEDERVMRSLSKVPPAMGLTGTTVGLVALFAEVGGADSITKIGPAMAVALTATLYGVLCAFMILNPMAEKVASMTIKDRDFRSLIMRGVLLLKDRASPVFIEEVLKSHLTFKQQAGDLKKAA
jgi:chemotaxis protein MotA